MAFPVVRADRVRVTANDECGVPGETAGDFVVSEGMISVAYSPEYEDRDEITQKNGAGNICYTDTTAPQLKYWTVDVEFCQVDPELFALMTGYRVLDGYDAEAVGFAIGEDVALSYWGLETWTRVPSVACDESGARPYGYFLLPQVTEGTLQSFTLENAGISFTINGRTQTPNAWGSGPYDVVDVDGTPTAGPLIDPLLETDHLIALQTVIAPPAATA